MRPQPVLPPAVQRAVRLAQQNAMKRVVLLLPPDARWLTQSRLTGVGPDAQHRLGRALELGRHPRRSHPHDGAPRVVARIKRVLQC